MSTLYYEDDFVSLYNCDARDVEMVGLVVSDPPFNIGFGYRTHKDRMPDGEYLDMMAHCFSGPSVMIHYPEQTFRIAARLGTTPTELVAWVYNSNHPSKMWRLISWFGIEPDLSLVTRPYKNPTDRRVSELIAAGKSPGLYDWWHIDQVKNVSADKTEHPCQMPLEVMKRILLTTPSDVVMDPFAGSGTTLRAAKDLGRKAVGVEVDERYCEIIAQRLSQEVFAL